jgi:hypothetical protein
LLDQNRLTFNLIGHYGGINDLVEIGQLFDPFLRTDCRLLLGLFEEQPRLAVFGLGHILGCTFAPVSPDDLGDAVADQLVVSDGHCRHS